VPTYLDAMRLAVESSPSILAYWDRNERCLFANNAYVYWFGRQPEQMVGLTLLELLGPMYVLNKPHIDGVLRGERQEFEREVPAPSGGPPRICITTYVPHVEGAIVHGFCVHVAEVTKLKQIEAELREALAQIRTLRGLIPLCAWCRKLRNDAGAWQSLEQYLEDHTDASVTHGMCAECSEKMLR